MRLAGEGFWAEATATRVVEDTVFELSTRCCQPVTSKNNYDTTYPVQFVTLIEYLRVNDVGPDLRCDVARGIELC